MKSVREPGKGAIGRVARVLTLRDRVVQTNIAKDQLDDEQRIVYLRLVRRVGWRDDALADLKRLAELECQKRALDLRLAEQVALEATFARRLSEAQNGLAVRRIAVPA